MDAPAVKRIRETLRGWASYGPLPDLPPGVVAYGPRPVPVDDLTDDQVIEIARQIAKEPQ